MLVANSPLRNRDHSPPGVRNIELFNLHQERKTSLEEKKKKIQQAQTERFEQEKQAILSKTSNSPSKSHASKKQLRQMYLSKRAQAGSSNDSKTQMISSVKMMLSSVYSNAQKIVNQSERSFCNSDYSY